MSGTRLVSGHRLDGAALLLGQSLALPPVSETSPSSPLMRLAQCGPNRTMGRLGAS